jgi:branched-chain amino acid transport system ATP-binding protein
VLILDEATEGLAPLVAQEIWRILERIRETGISSIVVDKNFQAVSAISDRNVILVKGQVVFDGDSETLRAQSGLLQSWLGV